MLATANSTPCKNTSRNNGVMLEIALSIGNPTLVMNSCQADVKFLNSSLVSSLRNTIASHRTESSCQVHEARRIVANEFLQHDF